MRILFLRVGTSLVTALTLFATFSLPANAASTTPLGVAQTAFNAARASNGAMTTSEELGQAALNANFNLAVLPNGYEANYNKTIPNDHGTALLVNAVRGGFGCVHISPSITTAPTSVRCPVPYLIVITPNVNASAKYLLATQVASAIGLESNYVMSSKSRSAASAAVAKILKLVSGVSAKRDALEWSITERAASVCLSFASNGGYEVRTGSCK